MPEAILQKLHFKRQNGIKLEKPNIRTLVTVPMSLLNWHSFKSIILKKQQGLQYVNFTKGFILQVDIAHHPSYFDVLR